MRRAINTRALTIVVVLFTAAPVYAQSDQGVASAFISLEARTRDLEEALNPEARKTVDDRLHRASVAWHTDPRQASALFNVVLRTGVTGDERVHLLIEAARAEVQAGERSAALAHFLEAAKTGRQRHHIAAAVEGYVAAAERAYAIPEVPPVEKYIDAVSYRGSLDAIGFETLYRLGRTLVRRADERAGRVLASIPLEIPDGRRALYLMAVLQLKQEQTERARATFLKAAEAPPYPGVERPVAARDQHVRELAWLAVGRLAFEAGDLEQGIYAYQQIPVRSPRFEEAFFEMGWLAMENGQEPTALLAFSPLVDLAPDTDLSRQAALLKGYVLLQQKAYTAAEQHYELVARSFEDALARFDAEVAKVDNLRDLARDCDTRTLALNNPLLAPVLERPEVMAAFQMGLSLEELATLQYAIAQQKELLTDMLAGRGRLNLLRQLDRDRELIEDVLKSVQQLYLEIDQRASRHTWRADTQGGSAACCQEPRLRARKLRERLETMIASIEERRTAVVDAVTSMLRLLEELQGVQGEMYEVMAADVEKMQINAVNKAIADERAQLAHMAVEGDAGVLEAVWRFKEDHRELIARAEQERKRALDELDTRVSDSLMELHEPEPPATEE